MYKASNVPESQIRINFDFKLTLFSRGFGVYVFITPLFWVSHKENLQLKKIVEAEHFDIDVNKK